MKKVKLTKKDLKWRSFEDVFKGLSKSKAFKEAYAEEITRRRLAKQICDLRISRQMTQRVVAQRSGMPQSVIANLFCQTATGTFFGIGF